MMKVSASKLLGLSNAIYPMMISADPRDAAIAYCENKLASAEAKGVSLQTTQTTEPAHKSQTKAAN
jgi:hypothetical protein